MKKRKLEAIDLFCGIGGLTYGLKNAGINVLAGLDNDKTCAFSYEKNNNSKFILANIEEYDFTKMKKMFSRNSVKVLVGCAPCQPFSSHTRKVKNKLDDTRWNLINYFIRAIDIIRPEVVSMENVQGITKTDVFKNFVCTLKEMNYTIEYKIVYAPDYGIPQNRKRLVLLASSLGKIKIPSTTHKKENYITVEKVIKKLPKIKAGETYLNDKTHRSAGLSHINTERIKQSKPGGTWKDWNPKILPNCYIKKSGQSYKSVYGRMSWSKISPTITTEFFNYGTGRFGHPEQDRAISLREGALLQSFPEHYEFDENIAFASIARHIGNAVPPRLGFVLGLAIKQHIQNYYDK